MITSTTRNLSVLLILLVICAGCDSANVDSAMEDEETINGKPGEVKVGDEAMQSFIRDLERFETGEPNGAITINNTDGENLTPEELLTLLRSRDTTEHEHNETDVEPLFGTGQIRGVSSIVVGDEPPSYRIVGFTALGWVLPDDPNTYNQMSNRKRVTVGAFNGTSTGTCRSWEITQCSTSFTYHLSGEQVSCNLRSTHSAFFRWGSGSNTAFSAAYGQC